jgi:hypothetical protein
MEQPRKGRKEPAVKFVDTNQSVIMSSTGTILSGFTAISQGVTVSQRTGDVVFNKELFINYMVDAENLDVFSTARVIIFQWHPNSGLIAPAVTDILQTAAINSFYSWQFASNYTILFDHVMFMSGLASAPNDAGHQGYYGKVSLANAVKKAEFSAGISLGSEQFFCLVISDSVAAPFPNINIRSRLTYTED